MSANISVSYDEGSVSMIEGVVLQAMSGWLVAVDFSERGNSASYRTHGWSVQEPALVWATGPRSGLELPVPVCNRDLMLDLDVNPCVAPPTLVGQILRVRVNGTHLGSAKLTQRSLVRCRIPFQLLRIDGAQEIEFEYPTFVRPAGMGFSRDTRPLAVSFFAVRAYTHDLFEGDLAVRKDQKLVIMAMETEDQAASPAEPMGFSFGRAGSVVPYLREGWDPGEPAFTWTLGHRSRVDLPVPAGRGDLLLSFRATPLIIADALPAQQVTLLLNGLVVSQFQLDRSTILTVPLPRDVIRNTDVLSLTFAIPTAAAPKNLGGTDTRTLGVAVHWIELTSTPPFLSGLTGLRDQETGPLSPVTISNMFLHHSLDELPAAIEAETGLPIGELLRRFESVGNNCEFGMVQRKMAVEVFNLLRFGNVQHESLMLALRDDFRAAADPSAIKLSLNNGRPREYVVSIPAYNIQWHTFTYEGTADEAETRSAQVAKLNYLRRKFYEGLGSGRKIYVLKREVPLTVNEALPILMELNRNNRRGTLLCVGPVRKGHFPGEVELLAPRLMYGHVGEFAPHDDVESADPTDWLRVVGNAMLLELSNPPQVCMQATT